MLQLDKPNSHNATVRDVSYQSGIRRATTATEWAEMITTITAHQIYGLDARSEVIDYFLKHCPEESVRQSFFESILAAGHRYLDSMIARNQPFIARETLGLMWRAAQALGEEAVSRLVSYIGDHGLSDQLPLKYRGAFELARSRLKACC